MFSPKNLIKEGSQFRSTLEGKKARPGQARPAIGVVKVVAAASQGD